MIVTALDSKITEDNGLAQIVYIPEGVHNITPSVDGVAKNVTVNMTAENGQGIAEIMQASLTERLEQNVRPYFDFDHNDTGPAAALPKRFYYEEGKGLMMELEWTGSGKQAIDARDYSYFSPTFHLGDDGVPVGLPSTGPAGSLVNEPAFRNIPRIAAAFADQPNKTTIPMSELITCGLLTEAEGGSVELATKRVEALKVEAAKVEALQSSLDETTEKLEAAEAKLQESKEASAASVIEAAIADGRIAAKDDVTQDFWKQQVVANGDSAIAALNAVPKMGGDITEAKVKASAEAKETPVELHGTALVAAALADEQESN